MIFFRVRGNVNVKIADNSLIAFKNFDDSIAFTDNEIYCTSYDDSVNIARILKKAGTKYSLEYVDFETIKKYFIFPTQLGVSNFYEINKINNNFANTKLVFSDQANHIVQQFFPLTARKRNFALQNKQTTLKKTKVSIAIIDPFNEKIGEILCGIRAIEILHEALKQQYEDVTIDLFIQSIDRIHFIRDAEILRNSKSISFIKPLPLTMKTLSKYDYFIDNSSLDKELLLYKLPKIDQFLLKFGINFVDIKEDRKRLKFHFPRFNIAVELLEKINVARIKGKLLLFHPYSPEINRSIPKDITLRLLRELVLEAHNKDFVVVSALKIDNFDDDCFIDLSKHSKSFFDFAYIVSQMDKIITTQTATMYLADLFYIPTVVIFSDIYSVVQIKYHQFQTAYVLESEDEKNLSYFHTTDERLSLSKYASWKKLKANDLIAHLV